MIIDLPLGQESNVHVTYFSEFLIYTDEGTKLAKK